MTPLRQRMTEDMQLRNLSAGTQRAYLHYITGLARFYQTSPEHLSLEEIREYQLYMINERQYSPESVNHFVAAAKFLYNITLETPWQEGALPRCRVPHKLPVVLSAVEVQEFFQHVCTIRNRAALMTAYGAGLRVSEVVSLQVGDIDSQRKLIRIRQGKGKKDRYAMLSRPPAGSAALLVAFPAPRRTAAENLAGGLAVPRLAQRPPHEHRIATGCVPGSGAGGRPE
jgi:integrase/recombinase XerD